jgi:1-acyl-sn-glycerol-3-phosphate acyltransferase
MDIIRSLIVWIVGLSFIVVVFPIAFTIWLVVLPFDRERIVIHWLLVYQALVLAYLIPIWKIDIKGREKAVRGTTYVIISNHQSIIDIILLNCLRYRFKWISKIENVNLPFLGWYLRMANYITVNRGNDESKAEMLEKSYLCLKSGISIMIFPEGTRSTDKEIGFFKRGAFQLAMQANLPILPVLIDGTGGVLPKHGLIFGSGHNIKIRVLEPVLPETFEATSPEELAMKLNLLMKDKLNDLRNCNIDI